MIRLMASALGLFGLAIVPAACLAARLPPADAVPRQRWWLLCVLGTMTVVWRPRRGSGLALAWGQVALQIRDRRAACT